MKSEVKISIVSITNIDSKEWDDFLQTTPESTFFCTADWWKTFTDSYILLARNNNGELIAGVPFRILAVLPLIGRYFRFSWLDSSVLVKKDFNENETIDLKKRIFTYLISHLRKAQVIVTFISTKTRSTDKNIYKELFNESEKCATLIIDISRDEEEIHKAFAKKKRYSIRQANKLEVQTKILEGTEAFSLIPDYMHLQNKLFEHKSKSYSRIYYKSEDYLKEVLSASDRTFIALAYHNGQPVTGFIMVSHKKCMYGYLGASDNKLNRATNASTLLEYEMMLYSKAQGFEEYDLGGVPVYIPEPSDNLYGVYLYKKGFGANRCEYDCSTYAISKYRYRFVRWLRKFETHPLAVKIYNILNGNGAG